MHEAWYGLLALSVITAEAGMCRNCIAFYTHERSGGVTDTDCLCVNAGNANIPSITSTLFLTWYMHTHEEKKNYTIRRHNGSR